ncbi:MAG: NADH-quinone oxidoreductase subunit C [Gammaproteobacteria bacterium]|nr:NADH-quinone oxidoreductase subunit C [Gammaproteobacteria bacterium]
MSERVENLATALRSQFADQLLSCEVALDEVTIEVAREQLLAVCETLKDGSEFQFEQLIDLCGVDYSSYGEVEWDTSDASSSGFSRGVESGSANGRLVFGDELEAATLDRPRFAVVIHLLSYKFNQRLRLRCSAPNDDMPLLPSVTSIWNGADWFEREAFDLFGILFEGHNDLRRILTDYGFVGHPFRKDFPLVGHVEMRYDEEKKRVIYEPVSIEPRVLVPRVIRKEGQTDV